MNPHAAPPAPPTRLHVLPCRSRPTSGSSRSANTLVNVASASAWPVLPPVAAPNRLEKKDEVDEADGGGADEKDGSASGSEGKSDGNDDESGTWRSYSRRRTGSLEVGRAVAAVSDPAAERPRAGARGRADARQRIVGVGDELEARGRPCALGLGRGGRQTVRVAAQALLAVRRLDLVTGERASGQQVEEPGGSAGSRVQPRTGSQRGGETDAQGRRLADGQDRVELWRQAGTVARARSSAGDRDRMGGTARGGGGRGWISLEAWRRGSSGSSSSKRTYVWDCHGAERARAVEWGLGVQGRRAGVGRVGGKGGRPLPRSSGRARVIKRPRRGNSRGMFGNRLPSNADRLRTCRRTVPVASFDVLRQQPAALAMSSLVAAEETHLTCQSCSALVLLRRDAQGRPAADRQLRLLVPTPASQTSTSRSRSPSSGSMPSCRSCWGSASAPRSSSRPSAASSSSRPCRSSSTRSSGPRRRSPSSRACERSTDRPALASFNTSSSPPTTSGA